jgi:hypothetical protein
MSDVTVRKFGKPNRLEPSLAEAIASPADGAKWGPAMAALPSDRHRAFVLALYQVKPGYGAHVTAAKLAGFGTSTSSAKSWSVIASRIVHDEAIQAAMREEDEKRIRASAPRAVRALAHLVETPDHRDHARAIGMVLDRVHPVETMHRVMVDHKHKHEIVATEKVLGRIRELALMVGLDPQVLPPTIDGTCKDVTDQQT